MDTLDTQLSGLKIPPGMEDLVQQLIEQEVPLNEIKRVISDSTPDPGEAVNPGGELPVEVDEGADTDQPGVIANIGKGVVQGADAALDNIFGLIPFPEGLKMPDGEPVTNLNQALDALNLYTGMYYDVPEAENTASKISKKLTQALINIIPTTKFLKTVGVGNRIVRSLIGGAVGEFGATGPEEAKALLQMIDMLPEEYGGDTADQIVTVLEDFVKDPDSGEFDELKSRMLNTVPGLVLGPAIEGVMGVIAAAKNAGPEAVKSAIDTITSR